MKRLIKYRVQGLCLLLLLAASSSHVLAVTRDQCIARVNDTEAKLQECITQDGLLNHLEAFQNISDTYGGRAAGTDGYAASVELIRSNLEAAGYDVTVQEFEFQYWAEPTPPIFEQVAPMMVTYDEGPDYVTAQFAGTADVTAKIQAVGAIIDGTAPVNPTAGGCSAADFVDFVPGNIALIQRGGCDNRDKALNAVAAGAVGLITFNWDDTNAPNTLQELFDIPVFAYIRYDIGIDLYRKSLEGDVFVRMRTDTEDAILNTQNVIADGRYGKPNSVLMMGAHLDSVGNAGVNDNGSGSAGLVEIATMMQNVKTLNRLRFAWWGAEEAGLVGSYHYVDTLPQSERNKIELYLNYDMIGSPNHIVEIYNVDNTDPIIPRKVKRQMNTLTGVYQQYFDSQGIPYLPPSDEEGVSILAGARSDHGPFIDYFIPVGGLFTGAEVRKTQEQVDIFGGLLNVAYDPCYHDSCDVLGNVNLTVHEQMTEAAASVGLQYAFDKQLNAKDGKNINVDYEQPKGRRVGHFHK